MHLPSKGDLAHLLGNLSADLSALAAERKGLYDVVGHLVGRCGLLTCLERLAPPRVQGVAAGGSLDESKVGDGGGVGGWQKRRRSYETRQWW